jgi:hypothetical protein
MAFRRVFPFLALLLCALPPVLRAGDDALLNRIWEGVQQAQARYTSGCGTLTETRTSALLARPLVLRGRFCAKGAGAFFMEYTEPSPLSVRFNGDYLNVTTGTPKTTEVINAGQNVRRTQSWFSRGESLQNLKNSFDIAASATAGEYVLKFAPKSAQFRKRINYVVVHLNKDNCLLRTLEVDGKSGVNSVFQVDLKSLNAPVDDALFKVYKP